MDRVKAAACIGGCHGLGERAVRTFSCVGLASGGGGWHVELVCTQAGAHAAAGHCRKYACGAHQRSALRCVSPPHVTAFIGNDSDLLPSSISIRAVRTPCPASNV